MKEFSHPASHIVPNAAIEFFGVCASRPMRRLKQLRKPAFDPNEQPKRCRDASHGPLPLKDEHDQHPSELSQYDPPKERKNSKKTFWHVSLWAPYVCAEILFSRCPFLTGSAISFSCTASFYKSISQCLPVFCGM